MWLPSLKMLAITNSYNYCILITLEDILHMSMQHFPVDTPQMTSQVTPMDDVGH